MKMIKGDSSSNCPKDSAPERRTQGKYTFTVLKNDPAASFPPCPLIYLPYRPAEEALYKQQLEAEEAESRQLCKKICETALRYYNKKHRTNYVLVELVKGNYIVSSAIWYHCNFTATDMSGDSGLKLFFAEAYIVYRRPKVDDIFVTACCILNGKKQVDKCDRCACRDPVVHPARGFKIGILRDEKRLLSLRPRPLKR